MTPLRELIGRTLGWVTGAVSVIPAPALVATAPAPALRIRNTITAPPPYEAAGVGRRARAWHAPDLAANEAVLGSVETLRQRSRAGVRNDGFAHEAIERLVANITGSGMTPQSGAPDPAFRAQVHQAFSRWCDEADAYGRFDFWGLQAQVVREWLTGGECFVRLRARLPEDGLSVPLQLQLLGADEVPVSHTTRAANGNRIVAGIELDALGRVVAYHFRQHRAADWSERGSGDLVRVPAVLLNDPNVAHVFEPERPGQLRGTPHLTRALIRLYEIDQFDDATIVRQKVASLFSGFVEREHTEADADVDPLSGEPVETDAEGHTMVGLEPGLLQELPGAEGDLPHAAGCVGLRRVHEDGPHERVRRGRRPLRGADR